MEKSPEEHPVMLFVNEQEIGVFQMTKADLEDWVYGYLYCDGMIHSQYDVKDVAIQTEDPASIHVTLKKESPLFDFSKKTKHFTSGFGRGITFQSEKDVKSFATVNSNQLFKASFLVEKLNEFQKETPIFEQTGGVHGTCMIHPDGTIIVREDIGRHNSVDKVVGNAIRNNLDVRDFAVLTTGRISFEMISKCAKLGFPVVISKKTATTQAVELAKHLNIELLAQFKGKSFSHCYSVGRVDNDIA